MPLFDAKRLVKEFEIIHPNLANEVKIIDNRLSLYCREDKTFSDIKDFKINGCARCMNVFTKLSNLYLINCKVY